MVMGQTQRQYKGKPNLMKVKLNIKIETEPGYEGNAKGKLMKDSNKIQNKNEKS